MKCDVGKGNSEGKTVSRSEIRSRRKKNEKMKKNHREAQVEELCLL